MEPKKDRRLPCAIREIQIGLKGYLKKPRFFEHWFRKKGQAYFFVFKKNLDVTNIQYAELLSLITRYRTDRPIGSGRLQFLTVQQFNATLQDAVDTFLPNAKPHPEMQEAAFKLIAERYADLLLNIVVVCLLGKIRSWRS